MDATPYLRMLVCDYDVGSTSRFPNAGSVTFSFHKRVLLPFMGVWFSHPADRLASYRPSSLFLALTIRTCQRVEGLGFRV